MGQLMPGDPEEGEIRQPLGWSTDREMSPSWVGEGS